MVELYNLDFKKMIKKLENKKFDIIYLDPPYKTDYIIESVSLIKNNQILSEDGIIIAETDEPEKIKNQLEEINVKIIDQRKYGRANLFFIGKHYR